MKTIQMQTNQIAYPADHYIRSHMDWQVAFDYTESMKTGANFPPIEVAWIVDRYYVVDGWHRLEAHKNLKQAIITVNLNDSIITFEQLYIRSLETNLHHGKRMTVGEKYKAIAILKEWNYSLQEISRQIQMPVERVEKYLPERMTNTVTGEVIPLRTPFRKYADTTLGVSTAERIKKEQNQIISRDVEHALNQLIALLQDKKVSFQGKDIKQLMVTAIRLLEERLK